MLEKVAEMLASSSDRKTKLVWNTIFIKKKTNLCGPCLKILKLIAIKLAHEAI